jgi:hypothetical protein
MPADRFTRTVEEEVRDGIYWQDYRSKIGIFLLPRPDDDAERAADAIREARAAEVAFDDRGHPERQPGPPRFPSWRGLGR